MAFSISHSNGRGIFKQIGTSQRLQPFISSARSARPAEKVPIKVSNGNQWIQWYSSSEKTPLAYFLLGASNGWQLRVLSLKVFAVRTWLSTSARACALLEIRFLETHVSTHASAFARTEVHARGMLLLDSCGFVFPNWPGGNPQSTVPHLQTSFSENALRQQHVR